MSQLSNVSQFVIDMLTWRTRVVADVQLEWCFPKRKTVRRELASLERRGFLDSFSISTILLRCDSPLFVWNQYTSTDPEFGKLCWIAEKRADKARCFSCRVYYASKLAERTFGGVGGKLRQPFQLGHDLGTAAVYLARQEKKKTVEETSWVSEDVLRRFFRALKIRKIPDAAIIVNGRIKTAIEFVGKDYSTEQLRSFHRYWSRKQIRYEIW